MLYYLQSDENIKKANFLPGKTPNLTKAGKLRIMPHKPNEVAVSVHHTDDQLPQPAIEEYSMVATQYKATGYRDSLQSSYLTKNPLAIISEEMNHNDDAGQYVSIAGDHHLVEDM